MLQNIVKRLKKDIDFRESRELVCAYYRAVTSMRGIARVRREKITRKHV